MAMVLVFGTRALCLPVACIPIEGFATDFYDFIRFSYDFW